MSFAPNLNPELITQPQNGKATTTDVSADIGAFLFIAGPNGSKVFAIIATSTDSIQHDVNISIVSALGSFPVTELGTASVPAGAGQTSAVPPANLLTAANFPGLPLDSDGNPYILLAANDKLYSQIFNFTGTITYVAFGGDF